VPLAQLEIATSNFIDAQQMFEKRNLSRWREASRAVDKYARWIIPSLYFIALSVIFSLDFSDNYGEAGGSAMFENLAGAIVRWKPWGTSAYMVVLPLLFAALVIGWLSMRLVARKKKILEARAPRKAMLEERLRGRGANSEVRLSEPSRRGTAMPVSSNEKV